jgi:hypothetical protein
MTRRGSTLLLPCSLAASSAAACGDGGEGAGNAGGSGGAGLTGGGLGGADPMADNMGDYNKIPWRLGLLTQKE